MLLLQCIFLGSLVADRNFVRAGIPGLTANNGNELIEDETVKKAYLDREKLIRKVAFQTLFPQKPLNGTGNGASA